jgi:3-oxoacid CoA-transferase subunit A
MGRNLICLVIEESGEVFFITGDTHGDFRKVFAFCDIVGTNVDDVLVILGDVGLNYFKGRRDEELKGLVSELPATLFCLHGNHEIRPENLNYAKKNWNGGTVWWEERFPNILFGIDGEIYDMFDRKCIVIGGAYSVNKDLLVKEGYGWWPDEQPSDEIKARVEQKLETVDWKVDVVLTHTCPMKYQPREARLDSVDQARVDSSTEIWLDGIEEKSEYKNWFCGHYHVDKLVDNVRFVCNDFLTLK